MDMSLGASRRAADEVGTKLARLRRCKARLRAGWSQRMLHRELSSWLALALFLTAPAHPRPAGRACLPPSTPPVPTFAFTSLPLTCQHACPPYRVLEVLCAVYGPGPVAVLAPARGILQAFLCDDEARPDGDRRGDGEAESDVSVCACSCSKLPYPRLRLPAAAAAAAAAHFAHLSCLERPDGRDAPREPASEQASSARRAQGAPRGTRCTHTSVLTLYVGSTPPPTPSSAIPVLCRSQCQWLQRVRLLLCACTWREGNQPAAGRACAQAGLRLDPLSSTQGITGDDNAIHHVSIIACVAASNAYAPNHHPLPFCLVLACRRKAAARTRLRLAQDKAGPVASRDVQSAHDPL